MTCKDSPSLQSQLTRIQRATRYGVVTWCHFQVTIGRVVMGSSPCSSPCSLSTLVSLPESVSCSAPESELEFSWSELSWLLSSVLLCSVSSLAKLGPLHVISNMQRKSAKRQVAAMFMKSAAQTVIQVFDSSAQVSLTLLLHLSTSFSNLSIVALSLLPYLPGMQLFRAGEAQPILMLVWLLPLFTKTS